MYLGPTNHHCYAEIEWSGKRAPPPSRTLLFFQILYFPAFLFLPKSFPLPIARVEFLMQRLATDVTPETAPRYSKGATMVSQYPFRNEFHLEFIGKLIDRCEYTVDGYYFIPLQITPL